jgi:hypothetical protein
MTIDINSTLGEKDSALDTGDSAIRSVLRSPQSEYDNGNSMARSPPNGTEHFSCDIFLFVTRVHHVDVTDEALPTGKECPLVGS